VIQKWGNVSQKVPSPHRPETLLRPQTVRNDHKEWEITRN